MNSPIYFNVGFLTNEIVLDDKLGVGVRFQRSYIAFYWKL